MKLYGRPRRCLVLLLLGWLSMGPLSPPVEAQESAPTPLTIRAVDEDGQPLAETPVALWPVESSYAEGMRVLTGEPLEPVARARTDSRGLARLEAPAPAFYQVGAEAWILHVHDELREVRIDGWNPNEDTEPAAPPEAEADEAPAVPHRPDPVEIHGTARDAETRAPVAGALVWFAPREGPSLRTWARTDEDGRYVLRLASAQDSGRLWAAAPGYVSTWVSWTLGEPPAAFALRPAATVHGRVVDEEDRPVEGAILQIGRRHASPTDPAGRFRLAGLRTGPPFELTATAPGFSSETMRLPPLKPGEVYGEIRIELAAGRLAFGRVVGSGNRPVPEAHVRLVPEDDEKSSERSAVTDAEGRFEISHLPTGSYRLAVQAPGFAPAAVPGVEVAGEGDAVDLGTVRLDPGERLEGRVMDPTGAPLDGVAVEPEVQRDPLTGSTSFGALDLHAASTDADGRFEILDLPPDLRLELRVSRDGYADRKVTGVRAPVDEPLEIVLQPEGRVEGSVVDENGSPVEGARVEIGAARRYPDGETVIEAPPTHPHGSVVSDAEGRFTVVNLPAGELFLRASQGDFLPSEIQRLEIEPGAVRDDVRLTLERGAIVTGRVLGPEGEPVARAQVRVLGSRTRASSDGDGRYRLEPVPRGSVSLEADHREYGRGVRDVEVEPGVQTVDLRLQRALSLSGRVVGEDDAPIPGAEVWLRWNHQAQRELTDRFGAFRFSGLEPGSYRMWAKAEGWAETKLPQPVVIASEGLSGLEIRLTPAVSIRGRVVGLDQDDLARTEVRAVRIEERIVVGTRPSWDGTFTLEGVRPGNWFVTAQAGEGRFASEEVAVGPNGADVELVFGEGLEITGSVLRNGEPVPGAMIHLRGRDAASGGMAVTDARGEFRMEGLKPGLHRVEVTHRRDLVHRQELELTGHRELHVELVGVSLVGRVVDADTGEPLADAAVDLSGTAQGYDTAVKWGGKVTDASGAFRFDEVGEGTYRLSASRSGYGTETRTVTVTGTFAPEPLEMALEPTDHFTLLVRTAGGGIPQTIHVAAVDASGTPGFRKSFLAGQRGRVRLESLPAGSWELWVGAPGAASISLPVSVPGPEARVTLPPAASLRVVLPEAERDVFEATVRVVDPRGIPYRQVSDGGSLQWEWRVVGDAGRIGGLAPGTWIVEATLPDGRVLTAPVQLRSGTLTSVTLE